MQSRDLQRSAVAADTAATQAAVRAAPQSPAPEAAQDGVTQALNADGGPQLQDAMYVRLRAMARRELARVGHRRTLSPTALVNEAWLKLAQGSGNWDSREHFLATMAKVMRHVLIDHARGQQAQRRGGDAVRVTWDGSLPDNAAQAEASELLAIDRALETLTGLDPRLERVVELRFFAGLTIPEVAQAMAVSEPTVKRDLRVARAFIAAELGFSL